MSSKLQVLMAEYNATSKRQWATWFKISVQCAVLVHGPWWEVYTINVIQNWWKWLNCEPKDFVRLVTISVGRLRCYTYRQCSIIIHWCDIHCQRITVVLNCKYSTVELLATPSLTRATQGMWAVIEKYQEQNVYKSRTPIRPGDHLLKCN